MAKKRIKDKNEVYYGVEQDYIKANLAPTSTAVLHALNFFSNVDKKVKQKYALSYAKTVGVKGLESVPVDFMVKTDWVERANRAVAEHGVVKVVKVETVKLKCPNDPRNQRVAWDRVETEIDTIVRGGKAEKYRPFPKLTVTQQRELRDYAMKQLSELSDDASFKEYYGFNAKTRRTLVKYLSNLVEILKPIAKVRKVRQKSPLDVVKKLQFMTDSIILGVKSINPVRLLGKQKLVVFNEKTRKIGIYHASSSEGFGIKGTTLTGFSTKKSVCKTDRNPRDVSLKIAKIGNKAQDKVFASIKTKEAALNGRINSSTILIAVY